MKKLALALLGLFLPALAHAQASGTFSGTFAFGNYVKPLTLISGTGLLYSACNTGQNLAGVNSYVVSITSNPNGSKIQGQWSPLNNGVDFEPNANSQATGFQGITADATSQVGPATFVWPAVGGRCFQLQQITGTGGGTVTGWVYLSPVTVQPFAQSWVNQDWSTRDASVSSLPQTSTQIIGDAGIAEYINLANAGAYDIYCAIGNAAVDATAPIHLAVLGGRATSRWKSSLWGSVPYNAVFCKTKTGAAGNSGLTVKVLTGSGIGNTMAFTTLAAGIASGPSVAFAGTYTGATPASPTGVWTNGCTGTSTISSFAASGGQISGYATPPALPGAACRLLLTSTGASSAQATSAPETMSPQDPGPSAWLFNNPYYTCTTNYYVAQAAQGGSDTNAGTSTSPWLTLAHANAQLANNAGGQCVNVSPSTTAYDGVNMTKSGASATAGGYIVYRCETLDGCTVKTNASNGNQDAAFNSNGNNVANYVQIDGFVITGTEATYEIGVNWCGNCSGLAASGNHHDWVLNCIISYAGQGGINFNNGDYTYALHNTLFQNAAAPNLNNYAQGSGLASVIPQDINVIVGGAVGIVTISTAGVMSVSSVTTGQFAINQTIQGNNSNIPAGETITGGSGSTWTVSPAPTTAVTATTVSASSPTPYVATADDKVNPNPLIGSFMNGTAWFHQVYSWNDGYNNWINTCNSGGTGCVTSGVTDGNFIILDTFGTSNGNNINYPDQTLVSYNLTYNNGGGGIHIYSSEYITVANNTSYNEHLGPYSEGASANTAALDSQSGFGDTFINNIGVGVPTNPGTNCNFSNPPALPTGWNTALAGGTTAGSPADVFTTNVLALEGAYNSCWNGVSPSGTIEPDGSIVMYPNNYAGFSAAANKHADPLWVSVGVGVGGTGTQSTPPGSANFALQPASPAIGYGVTETYLPPYSTDAGACHHLLSICP